MLEVLLLVFVLGGAVLSITGEFREYKILFFIGGLMCGLVVCLIGLATTPARSADAPHVDVSLVLAVQHNAS